MKKRGKLLATPFMNKAILYEHDCPKCKFLGNSRILYRSYDLYYCEGRDTIVARFGDPGPDYMSMSVSLIRRDAAEHSSMEMLAKGVKLAESFGYIKE